MGQRGFRAGAGRVAVCEHGMVVHACWTFIAQARTWYWDPEDVALVFTPKTPALYYSKKAGWQCAKKDDE